MLTARPPRDVRAVHVMETSTVLLTKWCKIVADGNVMMHAL